MESDRTIFERFVDSMSMNFEKWHDGIGYDLDALSQLTSEEKAEVFRRLAVRDPIDWRDIEALAALSSEQAHKYLRQLGRSENPQVALWVARYAPNCLHPRDWSNALIRSLESATAFSGLSSTLDQVAEFHPPEVIDALFRGALCRDGEVAVHFAAMLMYVHGQAREPFDWSLRPFYLTFGTKPGPERVTPFTELCLRLDVDPKNWL